MRAVGGMYSLSCLNRCELPFTQTISGLHLLVKCAIRETMTMAGLIRMPRTATTSKEVAAGFD